VLPNIVLIGFMGCGKSSVGRRIAALTGHRFVDTDEMVVSRTGRSITEIFAEHGEGHFRDIETAALRELIGTSPIVLATGGGIVLREENRTVLHQIGFVVWLDAAPEVLFERVSRNRKRPLLHTSDPRATFDELLASRRHIYEAAADFRIDSTTASHDDVASAVLEQAQRFCAPREEDGFGS
jgi:shikimate kinase